MDGYILGYKRYDGGHNDLLEILGRGVKGFGLIPTAGQFRQWDHYQILCGRSIRNYLHPFCGDLLIAFEPCVNIDRGERYLSCIRCLASSQIRNG